MKIFSNRTTVIGLLLCCFMWGSSLQAGMDQSAFMTKADRVLQTTSAYIITTNPDVATYCDNAGVKQSDLVISNSDRVTLQAQISGRYSGLITDMNSAIRGDSTATGRIGNKIAGTGAGVALIVGILAFLSLVFMFWWSIFECCYDKTCCVEKQKENESRGCCRNGCFIGAVILGLTCIALTIAWAVLLSKVTTRTKEIKCGYTIMFSDLVYGANLTGNGTFVGINGINSLFGNLTVLLNSIDSTGGIKSNAQTIQNRQITNLVGYMNGNLTSLNSSFTVGTYNYQGTIDNTISVVSGFAVLVNQSLYSGALKAEAAVLASIATSIDSASNTIANYDTTSLQATKQSLIDTQTNLDANFKQPLVSGYKLLVNGSLDYSKSVISAGKGFMSASIIVIIVLTLVFFVILFMNYRNKWHCMKIFIKLIMLIQLLLAVLILIFGIFCVIFSVIFAYLCTGIDGMLTTSDYFSTQMSGLNSGSNITVFNNLINQCVYLNGTGDLSSALGLNTASFNQLSNITAGMQNYTSFRSNLTGTSGPVLGKMINDNITGGIAFSTVLAGVPPAQDLITGTSTFNTYGCSSDVMAALNCPASSTQSITSDAFNAGLGSSYCVRHASLPSGNNYETRYTATSVTCTNSSITAAGANTVLTNIVTAAKLHQTNLGTLSNDYDVFYTPELAVFTALSSSVTDLDAILAQVQSTVTTLNSLGNNLFGLINCTIMRKEIILLENVFCFRIGQDIYNSTGVGIALGFILFIYSWFMCCSIRLTNKKDENKESQYQEQVPAHSPQHNDGGNHNEKEFHGYT